MTQMMIKSPRPAYTTTAKAIEGEFPDYQSYDKAQMFAGADGNYCTFACFMRVPHQTANYEGFIFGNGPINFWTRNWGWGPGPTYPNEIYINLNDSSYNDWYGVSQDFSVHGIEVGDWFALMISADLSAYPGVVQTWVQKVGESDASDISVVTPLGDSSPIVMNFANTDTITAMNSHPWFSAQSLDSEACELYFTDEFVDWSDPDVRALFVDGNGKPVGLGAGGINLTGTAARFYLPTGDGTANEGTAGNFTEESGPIIDAATSPTD